jgi:aspartyl-tRNA(Asn)/glutamyl-tRNA(Gln) amidotransferase subunit B
VLNWLTGQVMKRSGGKANPRVVAEMLQARLT